MAAKRKGASANQCGTHLDLSRVRIVQLVKEGVLPRHPDDSFDLDACRLAYIRYLRSEDRRGAKSATASRVQEARAKEIELRTARDEGRLWDADAAEAAFTDILGAFRSELGGVAAGSTRDLPTRAEIEKQLNDAIERCDARFANAAASLRTGAEGDMEGEETDA
jgi:hypothetical protein